MAQMTGGEAVIQALRHEGVEIVFGLPGVQIMGIYDAFYGQSDIRIMTVRHEQTTAYMADGYARVTGQARRGPRGAWTGCPKRQRGAGHSLRSVFSGLAPGRTGREL